MAIVKRLFDALHNGILPLRELLNDARPREDLFYKGFIPGENGSDMWVGLICGLPCLLGSSI